MDDREPAEQGSAHSFEIHERRDPDGTLVLSVLGSLDSGTAEELAERLPGAISRLWSLVIDLNEVEAMDSSALSVLLSVMKQAREDGCSVSLAGPDDGSLRVFGQVDLGATLSSKPEKRGDSRSRRRHVLNWIVGGASSTRRHGSRAKAKKRSRTRAA